MQAQWATLTENDNASLWYGAQHGVQVPKHAEDLPEGFIYRESHLHDPEWRGEHLNGIPVKLLASGLDIKLAHDLIANHNATLGSGVEHPPWMKFDAEHRKKKIHHHPDHWIINWEKR